MRRARLKLNPKKCVFGVTKGKILGCLISAKRIEANPDKIRLSGKWRSQKQKRYSEVERSSCSVEHIHFQIRRAKPPILQGIERKGQNQVGS
jgi:hypothetical protein